MNARALRTYAVWSSLVTIAIVATYLVGFRIGFDTRRNLDYSFAERLDRETDCIADAKSQATAERRVGKGFRSLAFYRATEALLSTQDCLAKEDFAALSVRDIYDITGVAFDPAFPGPDNPVWQHPDVPRKHLNDPFWSPPAPRASWTSWVNRR